MRGYRHHHLAALLVLLVATGGGAGCGRLAIDRLLARSPDGAPVDSSPDAEVASGRPDAQTDVPGSPRDAGSVDASAATDASAPIDGGVVDSGVRDAGTGGPIDPGPGCSAAMHASRRYVHCVGPLGWTAARDACAARGMQLVAIDDLAEDQFLLSFTFGERVWIASNDLATEGSWTWNGGPVFFVARSGPVGGAYVHWSTAEPNGNTRENCGQLLRSGEWIDASCPQVNGYICEDR